MVENNNIYIIGVGRSGTSLLQSMLNAHPNIVFLPETQFLRKYVFKKNSSINKKNNLQRLLERDEKFKVLDVNLDDLQNKNAIDIYQSVIKNYEQDNSLYVGDKDPRLLDYLPQLYELTPQSKIIHIIRDPRDVVLSRTKADWSKHWPFFMHSYLYNAQLLRGSKIGKSVFKENFLEIYYEELLEHPDEILKKITSFLEVPYSDDMLDFGLSAKKLVRKDEMQWKKETLGPLLSKNKNKWKTELTQYQVALIQSNCKDTFKNHSYEKCIVHLKLVEKLSIFIHSIGNFIFKMLYPLRVK